MTTGGAALLIGFAATTLVVAVLLLRVREERRRLNLLINNVADGIVISDSAGRVRWANDAYCRMFGYRLDEILGRNPLEFAVPPDQRRPREEIAAFRFDAHDADLGKTRLRQNVTSAGKTIWVEISHSCITEDGQQTYVLICRDVSENVAQKQALEHAQSRLEELVRTDQLTGISNRQDLETIIDGFLTTGSVGVAQIDLDLFKEINDIQGHAAGDAVLVHLARTMNSSAHEGAHLSRLGGDEFLIVLPDATHENFAEMLNRLRASFGETYVWEGSTFPIGLSIGATIVSNPDLSAEDIIAEADYALYASKANGRGRITFYDDTLRQDHAEQKALLADLCAPDFGSELEVFLQPALNVFDGSVWGVESLLRWRHPRRGLLGPREFAGHARKAGLQKSMDEKAMANSIATFHGLDGDGTRPETLSINISGDLYRASNFIESLRWTCDRWGVANGRIALDLNELAFNRDTLQPISDRISEVRAAGFRTIIDDFGMGALCLHQIAQMDIAGIKLARHLTHGIATDARKQSVMRAVMSLANDTGIAVIAKDIEREDDSACLMAQGCHILQGYLFARPMTADAMTAWLAQPQQKTKGAGST